MKKLFKVALTALALITVSTAAFADAKFGIVDVREILSKAPQVAAITADIQKQFKPREEKIVSAQKELQTKVDKLNRDGAVLSESERTKLQDKVISEKATLSGMMASFQQDLSNAQNKAMQNLMNQINAIITKLGNDGKYTLIVVRDAAAFYDKSLDITPQVLQQLGKK